MLDPSIMCISKFWDSSYKLGGPNKKIFVPGHLKNISTSELRDFYGSRLTKILKIEMILDRASKMFEPFFWEEHQRDIPDQLIPHLNKLKKGLEKSAIPDPIRQIFVDEFVFLSTHSIIVSRLKKVAKIFERLGDLPLINLENKVPLNLQKQVKGIKKAISIAHYVFGIGSFALFWNEPILVKSAFLVLDEIRMLVIDP